MEMVAIELELLQLTLEPLAVFAHRGDRALAQDHLAIGHELGDIRVAEAGAEHTCVECERRDFARVLHRIVAEAVAVTGAPGRRHLE